ncbi:peptidoglycan recognition protein family protein [Streptomyces apricus]|uniref:N-acetylmuramoyl-L-alanine amidase n=1 Tax=Streptomyces apricus TaxID=1828112 RepID=A0A5B0APE3_9ACTN|nr:peptidoglycan recognition protein [Streptomyces apricus]KAA0931878.1 N-acetylmuramoyl-L-alanine amidase [Streptomyces apricus]
MCAHRTPPSHRGARRPPLSRTPRRLRVAAACLPGLAAAAGLVLCAAGIDRTVGDGAGRPAAARPVAAHQAPKPVIVPRERWLGDASVTQAPTRYAERVSAVFVHHTDSPNGYDCADAPRIIQYLYTGQAGDRHWDDIGYNFLVDRCGTVYEGRAGGTARAVVGAHTQGFNVGTAGIAALGTFTAGAQVPRAMTDAIAAVAAWKLGLADIDPRAAVRLVSTNSLSRYRAGTSGTFTAVSGHTDGYWTACPGAALMARLPEIRQHAARLQGRR